MSYSQVIDFFEQHLLPCGVRQLTGLSCPGCGLQTAFIALMRGDLMASVQANPALLPYLVTIAYTVFHLRSGFVNGARNIMFLFFTTTALMIVNYIARVAFFW